MWDKKDLRYNKDGYFSLEGWFKLLNVDPDKDSKIIIMTATRNMGKSQAVWSWVYQNYWKKYNHKRKAAFVRTNDMKMQEALGTFRSAYNGVYETSAKGIIYDFQEDDQGRPIKKTFKEVGRFVNIENEHNYRSGVNKPADDDGDMGGFNNYHFVFWDEFNETKQGKTDLYQKFLMILSTIKRKNRPFILLLIGNKIDANNDIFVKLNLNTNDHDLNKDYIQNVTDSIVYVDIGYETYKHITDEDDMVNELASFDYSTNNMFNKGGFLYAQANNVRNANVFLTNKIDVINYFAYDTKYLEYGRWLNKDEISYYLMELHDLSEIPSDAHVVGLNSIAYSLDQKINKYDDEDDIIEVVDLWYTKLKNNNLYFDSFVLKATIEEWLFRKNKVFIE